MFSLNADKCQNKQNCALTRYYSSCSLEHLKKAILQDSCTHKWNAIEVEWQAKGRVCSTPKELMASLKQHAQRYISMYCSFWRSSKGGSDPHMHNNSAKSRHVHRIAYVTKPLARDPSADITDREAVHQAPHTRCSKRSSQTSKAQLSIWRSWRRGQGRCDNSRHKLHMRTRKITGSQPKWPTSKIEKKKKKLSKELYTLELLPRAQAQYRIHWLLSANIHDKKLFRELGHSYAYSSFTAPFWQAQASHKLELPACHIV